MGIIVWFVVYVLIAAVCLAAWWLAQNKPHWQRVPLIVLAVTGVVWTAWCNWQWFPGEFLAHFLTGVLCFYMTRAILGELWAKRDATVRPAR